MRPGRRAGGLVVVGAGVVDVVLEVVVVLVAGTDATRVLAGAFRGTTVLLSAFFFVLMMACLCLAAAGVATRVAGPRPGGDGAVAEAARLAL